MPRGGHTTRGSAATWHGEEPPRILLTSVFGPFGVDDRFSRAMNPMELYHNQVTRVQGPFSLRMFHRSWGLMLIQANIQAPCTVLDFPTLERFEQELRTVRYDVIGIGSIIPNVAKVEHMCRMIRRLQPHATIIVGGHVTSMVGIESRLDADHFVRGEGVRWMRTFLGEDPTAPIRHPIIWSGIRARTMGMYLPERPGDVAATVIPSVGCPVGCNFCATSAFFGGKGRFVDFYRTGRELFSIMEGLERAMGVDSFFVMDENFLLHRRRALELLDLMEEHDKDWALYVFSSANTLRSYSMDQLVRLGISWVWMGIEGEGSDHSKYSKLSGVDTRALVRELQGNGICVLGSTMIGQEDHDPDRVREVVEYAVSHETEFHQFMLYTPAPGTALWEDIEARGLLKDPSTYEDADIHGQWIFNYHHPLIPDGMESELLLWAFQRDFERNGPSVLRMARTRLQGYRRLRDHPSSRVRRRAEREAASLPTVYAGGLWAAVRWLQGMPEARERMAGILEDIYREFGLKAKVAARVLGAMLLGSIKLEERRLARGFEFEPPTFYERNPAAAEVAASEGLPRAAELRWVEPG